MVAQKSWEGKEDRASEFDGHDTKDEGDPVIIVDTSVVIKSFFPEEGWEVAQELLQTEVLGSPDLLLYEFSNYLVRHPELSNEEIRNLWAALYRSSIQFFVLTQDRLVRTTELARELGLTAYDASFIALAEGLKANLVTADQKLARKAKTLPFVRELI